MHQANHPKTKHFCEDVFDVNPREVVGSRRIALAWFSPTAPTSRRRAAGSRSATRTRPASAAASPASSSAGRACPSRRSRASSSWRTSRSSRIGAPRRERQPDPLRAGTSSGAGSRGSRDCGYEVEYRQLVASDYGAPTTRKRLFVIARSDGRPIVWPKPTHGPGLLPPRAAAECIDFSLPVHSIFLTKEEARRVGVKRPLADNTMAPDRARGLPVRHRQLRSPSSSRWHGGRPAKRIPRRADAAITGAHRGEHAPGRAVPPASTASGANGKYVGPFATADHDHHEGRAPRWSRRR
jgi:DNA (cytosine-5)-methyltransferase 1